MWIVERGRDDPTHRLALVGVALSEAESLHKKKLKVIDERDDGKDRRKEMRSVYAREV
jgi:hypothetical protein